jgi:hypothetical protein
MAGKEDPKLTAAFDEVMAGRLNNQKAAEKYGCNVRSLANKVRRAMKAGRHVQPPARGAQVLGMDGKAVSTGNGRVAVKSESLDDTSKRLIRQAVERNLQIAAYTDLEVNGRLPDGALTNADPKRAKAAALVVGILTDKCPGILGIDKNTDGASEMPDLTTAQGVAEAEAMFEELPADIKKALVKIA